MDNDIKKEIDLLDHETESYWSEFDKIDENTDWNKITEYHKNEYAKQLLGDLGNDIKNVVSGKIKVKLPFKMRFKMWIKRFFSMFD